MDERTRTLVWDKGFVIPGYDPVQWRRDEFGYAMSFAAFGDRSSAYGWEVEHITPVSAGGSDAIANLRPMNWQANMARQRVG